ncbi:DUF6531 domain-containing protein [Archangium violaceum]|uniref:DUF6531 domain-containing protein n=1 Tax=Archangium violaceum TaxID=83451 RepID=UPI0036DEE55C
MMPAVKHLDPVLGIDIHFIITPPGAVVPIPHPHIGIVFDPFDYIPIIGATVVVNGLPRAQAGTGGVTLPPHFPIGGVFAKPPGNENETFMGSSTVMVDDEPFTYMTLPVLSCQDIGMPSPPRKKGPGAKTLLLPTSIALSIPAGPPVVVGGPPTISLSGLMMKLALGALLKGLKKLRGLQKASRKMSDVSDRIHKAANKVMNKMGLGERARNRIHKAICTLTGHPVDVVTGRAVTEAVDWELPGPIPLKFERNYSSSLCGRDSAVGHGWSHSLDLAVWEEQGKVVYRAEDGREIEFDVSRFPRQRAPLGEAVYEPMDRLTLRRMGELQWSVEQANGLVHELRFVGGDDPGLCRVTRTRNRAGHAIHYEYDGHGRLEWVVDSARRRLRFEHDARGRLVRTWLPHPTQPGLVPYNRYVYSEAGDLLEAHDALGHAARYEYSGHLLVRETDRTGLSFYFEYEGQGADAWCVHTWGDGGIFDHRLFYNKEMGVTEVTNSLGHTTTYYSDGRGVVVKEVDPLGNGWQREFDEALRLVKEVDPLGIATAYEYDGRGNLVGLSGPAGATVSVKYDDRNLPVCAIDPMGGEWRWQYDSWGQLVEESNPVGERQRHEYVAGLPVALVGPQGERTAFTYDESWSLAEVKDAAGSQVWAKHDRLGRLVHMRDGHGSIWRVARDLLGRELRQEESTGDILEMSYNAEGHPLEIRGPLRQVSFGYAGFHQIASRQEAGARLLFKRDTEGQLVEVVNEAGESYRFELDARGRVIQETGFDGASWRYEYDAVGRPRRVVHPSQRTEQLAYDEAGRLSEVVYSDGTFRRFRYRLDGVMVEAENESGKVLLERDALGRVVHEQQPWGWVQSLYARGGGRVQVSSSRGSQQHIVRDMVGQVQRLTFSSSRKPDPWVAWFANAGGQEVERRLPGGVVSNWQYDAAGRPLAHMTRVRSDLDLQRSYRWRGEDQLAAVSDERHGATTYLHDARGRLMGARLPDGSSQHRAVDVVGNLFEQPDMRDRRYGRGGRLEQIGDIRYAYDEEGQLTARYEPDGAVWRYLWSDGGLLREVQRPDGKRVCFEYDPFGRRTCKRLVAGSEGLAERVESEHRWLWDGSLPLEEESSLEGVTTWVFKPDTLALLSKEDETGRYAAVTDYLGVPSSLYDETGLPAWRAALDIFGLPRVEVDRTPCPWRWPGQYEDPETGLYYNHFRYYDPSTGCYISQDPIRLAGGFELYAYVPDPLIWMDPFGLAGILNRGGAFAMLDKAKLAGQVGHHMPQNAFLRQIGVSRGSGPALGMTDADHELTRTFKGKGKGTMRADAKLSARQRLVLDIKDIRKLFGSKYDKGLRELIEYAQKHPDFQKPPKPSCK